MNIALPQKKEFLLSLVNNNYSQHTIEGYARDLLIYELFLSSIKTEFLKVTKLNISEYKGYLKTGQHIHDLEKLKDELKNSNKTKTSENNFIINDGEYEKVGLILEKALTTNVLRKSRSRGSRNNFGYNNGLDSRSINRMLSAIRSYLTFLIDIDYQVPIPPDAIKLVKTVKKESQVVCFEELVDLIEAPEKYEKVEKVKLRNRAILELLFSTGMRISELTNLDITDVGYDRKTRGLRDNKIYILGKGKKQRYVYMTPRCIVYLERYLQIRSDDFPAIFIPYKGKRVNNDDIGTIRVSSRYVQNMIERYRKLLGIVIPTTPHSLRHGFATYLAEQGANPAAIQRLLGHESLQTTTRYVHASDKFAEKSHKEYHPLSS